jgi:transposase
VYITNIMKSRYQYRIYPTDQHQRALARLFGCVRVVYNDPAKNQSIGIDLGLKTFAALSNGDLEGSRLG